MRVALRAVLLTSLGAIALAPAAVAADCTQDVVAAFQKQRTSKAFRVAMTQPTAEGPADMTVDYIPPGKMLQTVKSAAMAGVQQTILIGDHAYAGSDGVFEELLPQFTQSIVAEVADALGAPSTAIGNFECLGKTSYEGKDLMAYRSLDKAAQANTEAGKMLGRTIYVDPASGLPVYNVVATESGQATPVMKAVYSYPSDLVIEAPLSAPLQKIR